MCRISDKITFCTCADIDNAKNVWVFYSFQEESEIFMIGEPILPIQLNLEDDEANEKVLLQRINEPDAFDVPLNPKEKDALCIYLHDAREEKYSREDGFVRYEFRFNAGKWVSHSFEFFELASNHEEAASGEVVGKVDWTNFRSYWDLPPSASDFGVKDNRE